MKQLKLQLPKLPRTVGELMHSNQFLKFNVVAAYILVIFTVALLFVEISKPPVFLALSPTALPFEAATPPKPEEEIARAIRSYISLRYRWDHKTVGDRLRQAEAFIPANSKKAFQSASAQIVKFAQEKNVLQRVYPTDAMVVDLVKKTALVTGDRITAMQSLKAAADLKLVLEFEMGVRTRENPWGVYFVKEREE